MGINLSLLILGESLKMIVIGEPAPVFTLPATTVGTVTLPDYRGQNMVLYFYPKDSTPGCTKQSNDFKSYYEKFLALNTIIFGISRDHLTSHLTFKTTQNFPFELLSDVDGTVCKLYNVLQPKISFGKKTLGIERSTFLIDKAGILRKQWRKIRVEGHVISVLEAISHLS